MNNMIFERLLAGDLSDASKEEMKAQLLKLIYKIMKEAEPAEEGITALVLACTELPLVIKQSDFPDLKVIDTTVALVGKVLKD